MKSFLRKVACDSALGRLTGERARELRHLWFVDEDDGDATGPTDRLAARIRALPETYEAPPAA